MKLPVDALNRACRAAAASIGIAFFVPLLSTQVLNDALADYRPIHSASGTVRICGSPQMAELLKLYQSGFAAVQPNVRFENKLDSTLAAVSGVSADRAEIGLLGRELWPSEAQAFTALKGHPPITIKIAMGSYDVPKATFALMVFVPRDNPISSLSLDQLEMIFADSAISIHTWGELGMTGTWAKRPIHLYGFAKDNDKAQIFRRLAFKQNESWAAALKEFSNAPGPNGADAGELILRAVANDPDGIGISNVHYATPAVRALPLSARPGSLPVPPTRDAVAAGAYPLTRAVYMVVDPDIFASSDVESPVAEAVAEFLRFVLSKQGARAVLKEGNYLPLTPAMARNELTVLLDLLRSRGMAARINPTLDLDWSA